MSLTHTHDLVLEPASRALAEATAKPPFLYELSLAEARAVLDEVQAAPINKLPVDDRWITVPADVGDVRVRIVRPPDAHAQPPQRHPRDASCDRAGHRRPLQRPEHRLSRNPERKTVACLPSYELHRL
jgi:hypothetical protein